LEDNKLNTKRPIYNGVNGLAGIGAAVITGTAAVNNVSGGNTWPEIVGQLRVEQAWGGFHLSGSIINNHVAYNCGSVSGGATITVVFPPPPANCSELSGHPADKVGGAVNAAFRFNVPTGVNDALYIGGTYARGNLGTSWGGVAVGAAVGLVGGTNVPGAYGSLTAGLVFDSVYTSNPGVTAGGGLVLVGPQTQQLTSGYGGSIAFEHGWNAEWRTSIFGGAQFVDYNATANAILCSRFAGGAGSSGTLTATVGGAQVATSGACNWDFRVITAGTRTYWIPVRDFQMGFELIWSNHHSKNEGLFVATPTIINFKPNATYEIRDQNVFSALFAVRRFF
jgi:hypothetical protein